MRLAITAFAIVAATSTVLAQDATSTSHEKNGTPAATGSTTSGGMKSSSSGKLAKPTTAGSNPRDTGSANTGNPK